MSKSKNFLAEVSLERENLKEFLEWKEGEMFPKERYQSPLILAESLGDIKIEIYSDNPLNNSNKALNKYHPYAEAYAELNGREVKLGKIEDPKVIRLLIDSPSDKYEDEGYLHFMENLMNNMD